METLLLAGGGASLLHQLRMELRDSGYRLVRTRKKGTAMALMEGKEVHLVIACDPQLASIQPVIPVEPATGTAAEHRAEPLGQPNFPLSNESDCGTPGAELPGAEEDSQDFSFQLDLIRLARALETPILLIAPIQAEAALPRALDQGADYILFAPCDQAGLRQAIRTALLNGAPRNRPGDNAALEIIHEDRLCTITAGRERLARLLFAMFEQLHTMGAELSWCQSEMLELRQAAVKAEAQTSPVAQFPEIMEGIAHDFSNLLEAAGASATMLYASEENPAQYRAALEGVLEQARGLLEALLEFATPARESWRTEPAELAQIIEQAVGAALLPLRAPQVRVRVRATGLQPVWAHRALVLRCLINLIWNAVQAMPQGGLLSIVGSLRGNRVVLEVADTGSGISAENEDKILTSRFTTKTGHHGLGLSLVRSLLARCGGEVTCSIRPGGGSSFALALPVARPVAEVDLLARR